MKTVKAVALAEYDATVSCASLETFNWPTSAANVKASKEKVIRNRVWALSETVALAMTSSIVRGPDSGIRGSIFCSKVRSDGTIACGSPAVRIARRMVDQACCAWAR